MKEGEEETKEDDEGRRDGITYVVERREERVKGEGILLLRQSVWSRLLLFDATMYLGELSRIAKFAHQWASCGVRNRSP